MNNLWNRSVGPFDEAAAQRHRHMGLLDCNGDVNADAVNFLAHLCAGLFFDALCDSYVEMQTVSRICRAFCKSENVEAQRVVLMICSEYDAMNHPFWLVFSQVNFTKKGLRFLYHMSDFRLQPCPGTIAITTLLEFCSWLNI